MNGGPRVIVPALLGTVFLVYLNAFWGAFQFDDYNVIVDNPAAHSWGAWLAGFPGAIRPVLKFSYVLNWTSGLGVFGFHLFNITLHAVNAVLVYLLAERFMRHHVGLAASDRWQVPAFVAALLFALHPVQTEAVTYISGRSTSLMALFYLISLLAYVHGSQVNKRFWLYLVSPLFFVLAAGTKEVALTLPLALLLWEKTTGSKGWRVMAHRQAAHWLFMVAACIFVLTRPSYLELVAFGFERRSLHDNLLSQINGVTYLISRLFWIHRLSIDPDLPVLSRWSPSLVAQAALLLGMVGLGVWKLRDRPWLGFGLLWFFLQLLPTNSVVPRLDVANERQLYLAGWGLFLGLSVEAARLGAVAGIHPRKTVGAVALVLALLALATVARNQDYRSEISLWEDTVRNSPGKARAFNNLGYAYELAGCRERAIGAYVRAAALDPGYILARNNLGRVAGMLPRDGKTEGRECK